MSDYTTHDNVLKPSPYGAYNNPPASYGAPVAAGPYANNTYASAPYDGGAAANVPDAFAPTGAAGGASGYIETMEKSVRMGFIRKVFGILSIQLLVTFGITFLFVLNESVKTWVQTHPGALWSAIGLSFFFIIAISCFKEASRRVPLNFILLSGFTLCEAYLVGCVSSTYDTQAVLIAFGITVGVTLALTLFACQTRIDFTVFSGVLFSALIALMIFGFLQIWFRSDFLSTVYAVLGALIFSAYLVVDVQMIMGGKHAVKFTVDEYVFAALNVYLDIINLFLFILRLVGKK